jgi:hypothetical protein
MDNCEVLGRKGRCDNSPKDYTKPEKDINKRFQRYNDRDGYME